MEAACESSLTPAPKPLLKEVSSLTLRLGRLLFRSNANTEEVQESIRRFAVALDAKRIKQRATLGASSRDTLPRFR